MMSLVSHCIYKKKSFKQLVFTIKSSRNILQNTKICFPTAGEYQSVITIVTVFSSYQAITCKLVSQKGSLSRKSSHFRLTLNSLVT